MFWLPSRQRQPGIYLEKIQFFEKEFSEAHKKLFPQETHEAVPTRPVQISHPHVERKKGAEEDSPDLSFQKDDATLREKKSEAQEKGRIKEEFSIQEPKKLKENEDSEIAESPEERALAKEHHEIQAKLNEQYEKDRQLKKDRKKPSLAAAAAEDPDTLEEKEALKDFKDHRTLKRIFTLDITLKYEAFLNFFKELGLRIEEREGGICVWFNQELCKIFHRPHTKGNVVPYIDLTVAKRSLKEINITPSF